MAGGTLNLSTSGCRANVNRGTFNLSATVPFNLNGATLTNGGAPEFEWRDCQRRPAADPTAPAA